METKPNLTVALMGHVDWGKSTLLGQMLFQLGMVSNQEMDQIENEAIQIGKPDCKFAFILDRLMSERSRGITIQGNIRRFESEDRVTTVVDLPGHRDFWKNIIRGMSMADVGILVIGSDSGHFEASVQPHVGMAKSSATAAFILGIVKLIVVVTKMDHPTVNWSEERFRQIVDDWKRWLLNWGFLEKNITFIPVSGWSQGDNILKSSANMPWYSGTTLIDLLKSFPFPQRNHEAPGLMQISRMYGIDRRGPRRTKIYQGKVFAGVITSGSLVYLHNSQTASLITSLHVDDAPTNSAVAGQIATVVIKDQDSHNFLEVGEVISNVRPAQEISQMTIQFVFFFGPNIKNGMLPMMYIGAARTQVRITTILQKLNKMTGEVVEESPASIGRGDGAIIVIHPLKPIHAQEWSSGLRKFSRIIFMDNHIIIGAGKVISIN